MKTRARHHDDTLFTGKSPLFPNTSATTYRLHSHRFNNLPGIPLSTTYSYPLLSPLPPPTVQTLVKLRCPNHATLSFSGSAISARNSGGSDDDGTNSVDDNDDDDSGPDSEGWRRALSREIANLAREAGGAGSGRTTRPSGGIGPWRLWSAVSGVVGGGSGSATATATADAGSSGVSNNGRGRGVERARLSLLLARLLFFVFRWSWCLRWCWGWGCAIVVFGSLHRRRPPG